MPFMTDAPIILAQVNRWRIQAIHLNLPETGQPYCTLEVAQAYDDGETVTPGETINHRVSDANFLVDMMTVPSGQTMYAAMKGIAYARLKADGVVPGDATET